MATQSRRGRRGSRRPAVRWVGVPVGSPALQGPEHRVAVVSGRASGLQGPQGSVPRARPALPSQQPTGRGPASPTPQRPSGVAARSHGPDGHEPHTHHGRRAARAPTAASHKAPAPPVVLVTPAWRPAPFPRWARRRPMAAVEHVTSRGGALGPAPSAPHARGSGAGHPTLHLNSIPLTDHFDVFT